MYVCIKGAVLNNTWRPSHFHSEMKKDERRRERRELRTASVSMTHWSAESRTVKEKA